MRSLAAGLMFALFGVALPSAGRADPVQLYSRASLTSQTIDWSSYGSPGSFLSTPVTMSLGRESVAIGSSAGIAEVRQQGTDFSGNFSPGDSLLSLPDGYKSDVFDLHFGGAPVYGLGRADRAGERLCRGVHWPDEALQRRQCAARRGVGGGRRDVGG